MDRVDQRRIVLVAEDAKRALAEGHSTLAATIAASADDLMAAEVVQFRDYTPAQRRRMSRVGKALPDGSFPIENCSDAANAIRSIGRAAPNKRAKAEEHIRRRVRTMGCKGPGFDNWR
jgi:hypothetical protein